MIAAVKAAEGDGDQVVAVAVLGHKADLAFMVLGAELRAPAPLQTELQAAGLEVVDSYVSLTEVASTPRACPRRWRPAAAPPAPARGQAGWCFYPMSKQRGAASRTGSPCPTTSRKELMHEHGTSGRKFAGRVLQVVTGSTGLDDFEWGVTLFAVHPDDLKEVVYTMRFDEASAVYAEFGPFYTGW